MEAREGEKKKKRAGPAIFHLCVVSEGETLAPGLGDRESRLRRGGSRSG